jgi:CheY-like chemotaxis protein
MSNPAVETILIAHYDARVREVCSTRFREAGWRVIAVADGAEALQTSLAAHPEIVSASIFLSAIGGVELCRRLKRDRRTSDIRVILHSSAALLPGQCRLAREAGCDVLLVQPCLPGALFDQARQLLDSASLSPRGRRPGRSELTQLHLQR